MAPSRKNGKWTFEALCESKGSPDGDGPVAVMFKNGLMYGTSEYGGTGKICQGGCGTVFEVPP